MEALVSQDLNVGFYAHANHFTQTLYSYPEFLHDLIFSSQPWGLAWTKPYLSAGHIFFCLCCCGQDSAPMRMRMVTRTYWSFSKNGVSSRPHPCLTAHRITRRSSSPRRPRLLIEYVNFWYIFAKSDKINNHVNRWRNDWVMPNSANVLIFHFCHGQAIAQKYSDVFRGKGSGEVVGISN